jgi:AcrR family transcriptional regulator
MSPRRSVAEALETRETIVASALTLGSLEGLESLSFGKVAEDAHLSKSGVSRHFATKEDLQLAALMAAVDRVRQDVWEPVAGRRPGLERLRALMTAWLDFLGDCPLPGGCLVTAAATEFDGRSGPVRDAVAQQSARWTSLLEREIDIAVRAGELPAETDPELLALQLNGVALATNQAAQLHRDAAAVARAKRVVAQLLG